MNQILNILESKLGSYKRHNNQQYSFYCPSCSHHKPKLDVSIEKGVYHCWICQDSGTIIKLLKKIGIYHEELNILISFYHFNKPKEYNKVNDDLMSLFNRSLNSNGYHKEQPVYTNKLIESTFYKNGSPLVSDSNNLHKKRVLNYLNKKRYVSISDIIKYNIHYDIETDTILIPSSDEYGNINYFLNKKIEGKYINTDLVKKEDIIFNNLFIDWNEDIFIFEGFFDSLKINEDNVVVLLGSSLSNKSVLFKQLVKHDKKKYFCLDRDATKKSLILIQELLRFHVQNIYMVNWNTIDNSIKDFGDFHNKQSKDSFEWISLNLSNIDLHLMKENLK